MATKIVVKQSYDKYNKMPEFHELLWNDRNSAWKYLKASISDDYYKFTDAKQQEIYEAVRDKFEGYNGPLVRSKAMIYVDLDSSSNNQLFANVDQILNQPASMIKSNVSRKKTIMPNK